MPTHRERDPSVVLCLVTENMAQWSVMHSADTDGETFSAIEFDDDTVRLYTDSGREVIVPDNVYQGYGEPISCDEHVILEFDSFGSPIREYQISAPSVRSAPAFRG